MSEKKKDTINASRPKRKLFKFIKRVILILLILFTIFSISLVVLSQFKFFRSWALTSILSFVNKELIAKIEAEDLYFNALNGIELYNVRLITAGDTLAKIEKISLIVNYEMLLNQQVYAYNVTLENPNIKLLRSKADSIWNYNLIAPPSTDTSKTGPSPWVIKVDYLKMKNASFVMFDSTLDLIKTKQLDYDHINCKNLNLNIKAEIKPGFNQFKAEIRHLSFYEQFADLYLKNLSLKCKLDTSGIFINDADVNIKNSKVRFSAGVSKFNVFDTLHPANINEADIKLDLYAQKFNPVIINYFTELPVKIGRFHDVTAVISGNFRQLDINKISVCSGEQEIYIKGKLYNISNNKLFQYKLNLDNSRISDKSIKETLPEIDLKSLPQFGFTKIHKLYAEGNQREIKNNFKIDTKIGEIEGKSYLDFGKKDYKYNLDALFNNIDISKLVFNNELNSNLNGKIKLEGIGFDLKKMNTSLELELTKSHFRNLQFNNFNTSLNIKDSAHVDIVSLNANIDRESITGNENSKYDIYDETQSNINLSGNINLFNYDLPLYNLKIKAKSIDLKSLFKNKDLPSLLTTDIVFDGKGFNPDSIVGNYNFSINELLFDDRAIFPFNIKADFLTEGTQKSIIINSDFMSASLVGTYSLSKLIESFTKQGQFLSQFIQKKIKAFQPDIVHTDIIPEKVSDKPVEIYKFPNIEGRFKADMKDISIVNAFLENIDIFSQIKFDVALFSDSVSSSLFIDSLSLNSFDFSSPGLKIKSSEIGFQGNMLLSIVNSEVDFDHLDLKLTNCRRFVINDMIFRQPKVDISFDGEKVNFNTSLTYQREYKIQSKGALYFEPSQLRINIDSTDFTYNDNYKWFLTKPLLAVISPKKIGINQLSFKRNGAETIDMSGNLIDNNADNISLKIMNLPVLDVLKMKSNSIDEEYSTLNLNMDSIKLKINGNLNEPKIDLEFNADSLKFNNAIIGNLIGNFNYNSSIIKGNASIQNHKFHDSILLDIDVNSLPIYLGLDSTKGRYSKTQKMDISLIAHKLQAAIASPFAPGISELSGITEANITIDGILPDEISYRGNLELKDGSFKVDNTNISYKSDLKVSFINDKIKIDKCIVKNKPKDIKFGKLGSANVTGEIDLKNFKPDYLDIRIVADRLLVLSDATMAKMNDLYGDMIISTDEYPLRFYGTLKEPNLEGDVNLMYAELKMPLEQKRMLAKTSFSYEIIGDKIKVKALTRRDSLRLLDSVPKEEIEIPKTNLADLINYKLRLKIIGQFNVIVDMDLIGEMHAIIGSPDKTVPLMYEKRRGQSEAILIGEVIVKDKSIIKSYKNFNAGGTVSFRSGSIDNPYLDLIAIYNGTLNNNNVRSKFLVKMKISGYKKDMKVSFTYFIDGIEANGSQEQINEDALYLMVMGKTKSASGGAASTGLLNEGLTSSFSNFANKALSDLLSSTGVIQSAAFDFKDGNLDLGQASVKLTGQIYGGISWTFGGSLSDISGNNEITIEIPASEYIDNPFWSNFVLQITKASATNNTIITPDAKNWEVKVKFGSSW